jgi:hypothetical protein
MAAAGGAWVLLSLTSPDKTAGTGHGGQVWAQGGWGHVVPGVLETFQIGRGQEAIALYAIHMMCEPLHSAAQRSFNAGQCRCSLFSLCGITPRQRMGLTQSSWLPGTNATMSNFDLSSKNVSLRYVHGQGQGGVWYGGNSMQSVAVTAAERSVVAPAARPGDALITSRAL